MGGGWRTSRPDAMNGAPPHHASPVSPRMPMIRPIRPGRACSALATALLALAPALPAQGTPQPPPEPTPRPGAPAVPASGRARPLTPAASAVRGTQPLDSVLAGLELRAIGPGNMHGRTTDVEGVPGDPNTVYVGSAAGGLWKTTNGGTSWQPLFDRQPTLSIGDFALDPTNPDVIYVGTGEGNVRNSVSFGVGVFRSTDGGAHWTPLGLADTRQIARVLVNPKAPSTVYVCAIGHQSGPNAERGVFMSEDRGATWRKVLYLDDRHGCSDLDIDPQNPNVLYAGLWHFDRKQWTHTSGDTLGGIWKSGDGGRTWRKVTQGLPKLAGRIGVKVAASQPNVVYAAIESNDGILFRSDDRGERWTAVNRERNLMCRGFYYADLRVDPTNADRVWMIGCQLSQSIDGGRTFRRVPGNVHGDHHGMWIDPTDARRQWQVNDGGIYGSRDGGQSWELANGFPLAQLYQIHADDREPFYHLTMGLQDNGNWTGPSRTRDPLGILGDDWRIVSYGDGYYSVTHPEDPDLFLTDQQGGWIYRTDMRTLEQQDVSPQPRRADGDPVNVLKYRFNWNAPIVRSPHDGKTVYFGAQVLFRSRDFGSTWEVASPDLSKNDATRIGSAGGPVWRENTTAEYYANIFEIAESPVKRGLIWAGTDDGNLQLTQDDGRTWTNVAPNLRGLGADAVVSAIEPSRTAECTAYAGFDRHLSDDYRPYVYRTTDCGRSWRDITGDLPPLAYVHVVREDRRNPSLLYVGTEIGLFASWDGGGRWHRLTFRNLPAVPVHEVLVHPRENDLIVATHGRGVYILDDATPLQQMRPDAAGRVELYDMRTATRHSARRMKGNVGDRVFRGANPPYGAPITYRLPGALDSATALRVDVLDAGGRVIRTLRRLPRTAGMQRVWWGLDEEPPRPRRASAGPSPEEEFFGPVTGPRVLPGTYTVRLVAGTDTLTRPLTVRLDPTVRGVTEADLRAQYEAALRLRTMQSAVNDTLRALDAYRAQLAARRSAAEAIPDGGGAPVARELARQLEVVDTLIYRTVKPTDRPFYSEGPRVADRIGALLRSIDGGSRRPTAAQLEHLRELEGELRQALEEARRLLGGTVITSAPPAVERRGATTAPGRPSARTGPDGGR